MNNFSSLDNFNNMTETIMVGKNFYIQRNVHSVYQVMMKNGGQCFGSYNIENAKQKMKELESNQLYL